jgi:hypothetical protein
MKGKRPQQISSTEYSTTSILMPKGINKNVGSLKKTSSSIKLGIYGKLLALVLLASHLLIVSSITTTPLMALSLKNNSSVIIQNCPKVCVCKLTDQHSINTDCTNANLTSVPYDLNINTTSL